MKFKSVLFVILFIVLFLASSCHTKKKADIPCPAFSKKTVQTERLSERG